MGDLCLRMTAKSRISRSSSSIADSTAVSLGCRSSFLKCSGDAAERPSCRARMLLCQVLPQVLIRQSDSLGANTLAYIVSVSVYGFVEDSKFYRTSKDAVEETTPHPGFQATRGQYKFAWPCGRCHGCGRPPLAFWTLDLAFTAAY